MWSFALAVAYALLPGLHVVLLKKIIAHLRRFRYDFTRLDKGIMGTEADNI
jgi:hypothetical protein